MPVWLATFLAHWATKTGVIVLLLAILGFGLFTAYRVVYNKGYTQARIDYPQTIVKGNATIIQGKKMGCIPLHIGDWGFGLCHN